MQDLTGKVAWITGGGSGIGAAGARKLGEAGVTVILSGRRQDALEKVAASITDTGGKAEVAPLDVMDKDAVETTVQKISDDHGRLDILINSAGLNFPERYWSDVKAETWDKVIGINLNGTFYCCRAALPLMRASGSGLIVNVSSWAGKYVTALTGPAYDSSKHALVAMTESLNQEEGRNNIRATALCPGEVATEILNSRPQPVPDDVKEQMMQADDLGETLLFLARMPQHVCFNEILISPTWNRFYTGFD